jgi:transitional endoplasmic reticulum ATPase
MTDYPAPPTAHESAFFSILSHFSNRRASTELSIYNALRRDYPEYEIVATKMTYCHLLSYVEYGLATATPINGNNHDISRVYKPPTQRNKKKNADGKLKNEVRVGLWEYLWEGNEYLYYHVEYDSSAYGTKETIVYLLSRKWPLGATPETTPEAITAASEAAKERIDTLLMAVGKWSADLHSEIYVFDNSAWRKDRKLYLSVMGTKWSDVILSPSLKDGIINDITTFFDSEEMYTSLNIPWKRGIILHGTPGNGKTLSIKALINTLQTSERKIPSLYVKNLDNCNYGPKKSIREIFTRARTMAPCVLIFEDLDSLVTNKIRAYFLNEVDGLESNDGICMIGSTNHLNKLDPAIAKRPSRFDRKYHFGLPGFAEREAYCAYWGKKLEGKENVKVTELMARALAGFTEGFSFAYLKELFLASLVAVATKTEVEQAAGEVVEEEAESASSDSTVVVEKADTVMEGDAEVGEGADKTKVEAETPAVEKKEEKEKVVVKPISEDEIPEELRNSIFLRVLCQQITSLRREMDDKGNEEKVEAAFEPGYGYGDEEDDSD